MKKKLTDTSKWELCQISHRRIRQRNKGHRQEHKKQEGKHDQTNNELQFIVSKKTKILKWRKVGTTRKKWKKPWSDWKSRATLDPDLILPNAATAKTRAKIVWMWPASLHQGMIGLWPASCCQVPPTFPCRSGPCLAAWPWCQCQHCCPHTPWSTPASWSPLWERRDQPARVSTPRRNNSDPKITLTLGLLRWKEDQAFYQTVGLFDWRLFKRRSSFLSNSDAIW